MPPVTREYDPPSFPAGRSDAGPNVESRKELIVARRKRRRRRQERPHRQARRPWVERPLIARKSPRPARCPPLYRRAGRRSSCPQLARTVRAARPTRSAAPHRPPPDRCTCRSPPFGIRRRKARNAVWSSRIWSNFAAVITVDKSRTTKMKRVMKIAAAIWVTAKTILRRKAGPHRAVLARAKA